MANLDLSFSQFVFLIVSLMDCLLCSMLLLEIRPLCHTRGEVTLVTGVVDVVGVAELVPTGCLHAPTGLTCP